MSESRRTREGQEEGCLALDVVRCAPQCSTLSCIKSHKLWPKRRTESELPENLVLLISLPTGHLLIDKLKPYVPTIEKGIQGNS